MVRMHRGVIWHHLLILNHNTKGSCGWTRLIAIPFFSLFERYCNQARPSTTPYFRFPPSLHRVATPIPTIVYTVYPKRSRIRRIIFHRHPPSKFTAPFSGHAWTRFNPSLQFPIRSGILSLERSSPAPSFHKNSNFFPRRTLSMLVIQ